MGTGVVIYPVAESVPFDNEANNFVSDESQSAIEEARDTAPGTASRYVITFGYDGTAYAGRWLEIRQNTSSKTNPYIVAEPSTIKAFAISTKNTSSGTMKLYKNGSVVFTYTMNNEEKGYDASLNISLVPGDELSMKVTTNSFSKPSVFISIKVNV